MPPHVALAALIALAAAGCRGAPPAAGDPAPELAARTGGDARGEEEGEPTSTPGSPAAGELARPAGEGAATPGEGPVGPGEGPVGLGTGAARERPGPNVVLVLADDLAFRATGFGGNARVATPHLDRLAAEGVRFERAYVPSGWCMPSRASILTGRYPHATGVVENGPQPTPAFPTWASRLRELGWATGVVGKWHSHNRDFDALGFTEHAVLPVPPSPGDYSTESDRMYLVDGDTTFSDRYVTDYFTDAAVEFLERHADEPFALELNYNAPHRSGPPSSTELWHFAEGFAGLYDPDGIELPATAGDDLADKPAYHRADRAREVFAAHSPAELRRALAQYLSIVTELDEAVGRVLGKLEALGLAEETVVVFSSDNGIFLGEHGMLLKGGLLYEEQVRVPLVVRAPGVAAAGAACERPVNLLDLAPTLLELAGGTPDPGWQGRSLVELLRAPDGPPGPGAQEPAVLLQNGDRRGLVTARWKLVDADGAFELYDLAADPLELVDLAGAPEHAATLADLRARLWSERQRALDDERLP